MADTKGKGIGLAHKDKYKSYLPSVSPAGRGGCQQINRADKYDKQIFTLILIPINDASKFTPKLSHLLNQEDDDEQDEKVDVVT